MGEEDETTALLPDGPASPQLSAAHSTLTHSTNSNNMSSRIGKGVFWNRILILLLLAALTVFGIFSETKIHTLQVQLESVTNRATVLENITAEHSQVIERFSSSVTNADVVERLASLETNLTQTVHDLHAELKATRQKVNQQLDDTVHELNDSVRKAEDTIKSEVEKVKTDVDQYVIDTQDQFSMENSFMIYQLAGTFTLLSCLISMWHMTAHLRRMNQPDVQRKILAILWMSPIYAVTSWFSLVFHPAEGYLAILKDGYEAYVIYQFLSFLIAVLGKGDRNKVVDLLAKHADHLTPPFRLCGCFELCGGCCGGCGCCQAPQYENNRELADAILLQCQLFAMQFVFLRPLTTTAMVVLENLQYYGGGDGPMDYRAPQFYITIVQNISIFTAFAGLLKFYHAVDQDLAWCRPFAKFLCIKGVVFMTFWQGLAISVLAQTTDVGGADPEEFAKTAQNFLICLEMLLFSIAHFYCFPTEEWEEGYRVKHSQGNFGDSIALNDFLSDLKLILKPKKKKKKITTATIPEGDDESESGNSDAVTEAISVTTSVLDDEERAVVEALEELSGDDDDPVIAEAKQRLIESKVLSPKFFDYSENSTIDEEEMRDDPVIREARNELGSFESYEDNHTDDNDNDNNYEPLDNRASHTESPMSIGVSAQTGLSPSSAIDHEDSLLQPSREAASDTTTEESSGEVITERTSLLFHSNTGDGGSTFAETLRPSIFTTVASLAESEKQVEERTEEKEV